MTKQSFFLHQQLNLHMINQKKIPQNVIISFLRFGDKITNTTTSVFPLRI